MGKPRYDGVIEAVRYNQDGQIEFVRAFLRMGSIWSDYILLDRDRLMDALRSGKKFMYGRRLEGMAGTFETYGQVKLAGKDGKEVVVTGDTQSEKDQLAGVPLV